MSKLLTLRQRAHDIDQEIEALSEKVTSEKRAMTDDERTQLASLKQRKTEARELLQEAEEANDRVKRLPTAPDPDADAAARAAQHMRVAVGQDRAALDPTGGFPTVAAFGRAVRNACTPGGHVDERLTKMQAAAADGAHTGTGGAGEGYGVPAAHRDEVFELAFPGDDLVSAMMPEPTDSNAVDIETDETTPWGATGVQAFWRNEASQMTATKTKENLDTVRLQELYAFVKASEELLSDNARLQNRLTVKSAQAIRWKASEAIVNGSGAGQPLGWMLSGALVTITKEGSQVGGTIVAKNVLKMFSRLIFDGGSPFWLAHSSTLPEVATMTIGDQPIWTPPVSGMKIAPNGALLGLPLRFSEHAETVGTKGDLQLVNPAGYYATIKRGEGMKFASSIHLYFDYNLTAFRWLFRLGGQPFMSAPVEPAKGNLSKSHFVVLETRS